MYSRILRLMRAINSIFYLQSFYIFLLKLPGFHFSFVKIYAFKLEIYVLIKIAQNFSFIL